jgi:hypothetical protein
MLSDGHSFCGCIRGQIKYENEYFSPWRCGALLCSWPVTIRQIRFLMALRSARASHSRESWELCISVLVFVLFIFSLLFKS